jgi:hypothetical protein
VGQRNRPVLCRNPARGLTCCLRSALVLIRLVYLIPAGYVSHYNTGRSHQDDGMNLRAGRRSGRHRLPVPATQIHRKTRLAGLINEYRPAA